MKPTVLILLALLVFGCDDGRSSDSRSLSPVRDPDKHLTPESVPRTGQGRVYFTNSTAGKISITTRPNGDHIWVKIENHYSKRAMIEFFIRSGASYSVAVPAGTYRIKMASGTTWYGPKHFFGSRTGYSIADDTFPITYGDHWTVELIPRRHGNLREKELAPEDF